MKRLLTIPFLFVSLALLANDYDQQRPFGFCTRSSRTNAASTYNVTGGGCYTYPVTGVSADKVTTLTSTGKDMKSAISNAIKNYSVIIFDGSQGDFLVSSKIGLSSYKNKTLIGINGARLCTTWYATQEIIDALNAAGVPSMSTSGGGGTLPNGTKVTEEAEYHTRRIIIEMTGDKNEAYRNSGVLSLSKCENIIIRNLKFVGPGSIDVGGSDLLSFTETKNCWVDHCDFTDGMDGNFDITQKSDFNTVSWCSFSYTDRSYMHQNTNLIGSSDSESTGYLNTTFAFCHWGKNCRARMPMARMGKIHMLNNYFTTTTGSNCINPRKNSEFLIEGNYFAIDASKSYSQSGAIAVTWRSDNYFKSGSTPSSLGSTVSVPYDYTVADVQTIPSVVSENVGATLYTATEPDTFTLSLTSIGNGEVAVGVNTIINTTQSLVINEGTSATLTITPNDGYYIKSLVVNGVDLTSSVTNNQYTINDINQNTTVVVTFEEIVEPEPDSFTLSITSIGNGEVTAGGNTIINTAQSFVFSAETTVTLTITPKSGYRIKSVVVNDVDVTSSMTNQQYTINNISQDMAVVVMFEAIPPTEYTFTIKTTGYGEVAYGTHTVRNSEMSFTVVEGSSATMTFLPDNGNHIERLKVNGNDVTSGIQNKSYVMSITQNTTVEVSFVENITAFTVNGINYAVTSYGDRTVVVSSGDYGEVLEVPASVTYQGDSWRVTGIDNGALGNNAVLSAVIWNPAAPFTLSVSNPNLLLYVTSADYAPASVTNVIVGNTAERIVLTDGDQDNDFNCPREFTAKKISYTHAYVMTTGVGESRGWETIALPFDVQKITHSSKGEIAPFAARTSGDTRKPFWLMEYGSGGWTRANSIKANKPYIISMPNNTNYKTEYRLAGNITFSAEQTSVRRTADARPVSYGGKSFTPNYVHTTNAQSLALNVNNDYVSYIGGSNEGSRFILNLRALHPFEAYMTTTNSARWIDISDDMTTGIDEVTATDDGSLCLKVYNLNGQLVTNTEKSIDKVRHELPAGVYIVNGQKLMIRK